MFVPYVPPQHFPVTVNSAESFIPFGSARAYGTPRADPSVLTEFDTSVVVPVLPVHCMSSRVYSSR